MPFGTASAQRSRKLTQRVEIAGARGLVHFAERDRRRHRGRRQHRIDAFQPRGEFAFALFPFGQDVEILAGGNRRSRAHPWPHRFVQWQGIVIGGGDRPPPADRFLREMMRPTKSPFSRKLRPVQGNSTISAPSPASPASERS